jgi:hypothetical protein
MVNEIDDLFNGNLDNKMSFLNEPTKSNTDGIYRVDLSKAKDKKKGYRSVIRFLPNLTKEGKVAESALEKISHYVDIKQMKELSGFFDSPKNFGERCALSDLYYQLMNSKNAILQERAKMLKYSRKYYSYVLILEDEQQPDLVGKIMVFQYGKTIKDKIQAEKNGDISGVPANIFDLANGKDFVLMVKEISTGDETYPDYKMSTFKPETSSIQIYNKDRGFKHAPTQDGKIDPKAHSIIKDFLMDRAHELEDFGPKKLDDSQQNKVNEIINFMTGKSSSSYQSETKQPSSNDFDFEESLTGETKKTESSDDDDFFSDFK